MIYCNLKGGLGNMYFQIAATFAFAKKMGVGCSFPNLYENLWYLNSEKTYNPVLNYSHEYLKILNVLEYTIPTERIQTIKFPFHYENIDIPNNCYIDGFFQSEKYFKEYRSGVLELLKRKELVDLLRERFNFERVTSIHVRRGDYVRHPNHHPVQDISYYMKGVEILDEKTDQYFVFSDDIKWCKENFIGDKFNFIENERDYDEIYMMSLCENNIISNSSFSWWGAWLNENENIVIAPAKWFGQAIKHNTSDIYPENWIVI